MIGQNDLIDIILSIAKIAIMVFIYFELKDIHSKINETNKGITLNEKAPIPEQINIPNRSVEKKRPIRNNDKVLAERERREIDGAIQ